MGINYHYMTCSISGIMYTIQLDEDKDTQPELKNNKEYEDKGMTANLLPRLCKGIFNSGFCILQAIIELKNKMGVFASAMIKKR